jgi:CDP-diglyceride synthetase
VTAQPPDEPTAPAGLADAAPRRHPLLLQGAAPALLAVGLAVAAQLGPAPFVVVLLGAQLLLVHSVLRLLDAPASGGAFLLGALAAVAADAALLYDDGDLRSLAGVVAVAFVAALLHQLVRSTRTRVTESLADTLVGVVLGVSLACLLALRELEDGVPVLQVALAAAGASLLAARVGDRLRSRPELVPGSTRGWVGLLLGLVVGTAAAVLVAALVADGAAGDAQALPAAQAALLALVCVATVAAADLAVDLGAAELGPGRRDARRVDALGPAGLLLPFALLGPIALVAGELVLR